MRYIAAAALLAVLAFLVVPFGAATAFMGGGHMGGGMGQTFTDNGTMWDNHQTGATGYQQHAEMHGGNWGGHGNEMGDGHHFTDEDNDGVCDWTENQSTDDSARQDDGTE